MKFYLKESFENYLHSKNVKSSDEISSATSLAPLTVTSRPVLGTLDEIPFFFVCFIQIYVIITLNVCSRKISSTSLVIHLYMDWKVLTEYQEYEMTNC